MKFKCVLPLVQDFSVYCQLQVSLGYPTEFEVLVRSYCWLWT